MAQGILYYTPVVFQEGATFDAWGINVASGNTAHVLRLGLYEMGDDLSIGALVLDLGTADLTNTGVKTVTISPVLDLDGAYWLATVTNGAPNLTTFNNPRSPFSGYANAVTAAANGHTHRRSGQSALASGGLPSTPVAPDSDIASGSTATWSRFRQVAVLA